MDIINVYEHDIYEYVCFYNISSKYTKIYDEKNNVYKINDYNKILSMLSKQCADIWGIAFLLKHNKLTKKYEWIAQLDLFRILYNYYVISIIKINSKNEKIKTLCLNSSHNVFLIKPIKIINKKYLISYVDNNYYIAKFNDKYIISIKDDPDTIELNNECFVKYIEDIKNVFFGYFITIDNIDEFTLNFESINQICM